MKLSKSKLALAKVINENGGWHGNDAWLFSTQSGDGVLKFWSSKPKALKGCVCTEWSGGCRLNFALSRVIKNWHQTILSREEYYQAYPNADDDGWIEWNGGKCQVDDDAMVEVKLRNPPLKNLKRVRKACEFDWRFNGMDDGEIIAYRLHKPEVKPEFCESVTRSIQEPNAFELEYDPSLVKLSNGRIGGESIDALCAKASEENKHQHIDAKPTIEQLAHDYRNAKDYANRLQKEADDALLAAEKVKLELIEAGNKAGLVVTPHESGGFVQSYVSYRAGEA